MKQFIQWFISEMVKSARSAQCLTCNRAACMMSFANTPSSLSVELRNWSKCPSTTSIEGVGGPATLIKPVRLQRSEIEEFNTYPLGCPFLVQPLDHAFFLRECPS